MNPIILFRKKFLDHKDSSIFLIIKLLASLNYKFKRRLGILFLLILLNAILEGTSIAIIYSFLSILTNINSSSNSLFIITFFNNFGIYKNENILIIITISLVVLFLISGAIRLLNLWTNSMLSESIGAFISTKIVRNTLYQPYIYHKEIASNEIINSATFCSRVTSGSIDYLLTLITSFLLSFSILTTILIINFRFSILTIIFSIGIYFIIALLSNKRIKKNSIIQLKLSNKQIEIIQISLNSIKDILLSSNQNYFINNYEKTDKNLRRKFGETKFIASFPKIIIESFALIFIAIIGFFIFRGDNQNLFLIPTLGTVLISLQKLFPYNQQIFSSWARIKSSRDSIKSVIKLTNLKPKIAFKKENLKFIKFKKTIELKNISYTYPNSNKEIIKDFSITINKGSRIGIMGETGRGKSTLLNILMGLLIPKNGQLLVDGVNLYSEGIDLELASWSSKIAHVPQEISLLNNNFIHNIAFGIKSNEIDNKQVRIAAKIACIDEFISSQENKYESLVGENGSLISGGQRQRLAIARALYKNLDILILDEATSALDSMTERKLINSIFSKRKKLTIILVSHKMNVLKQCDEIIRI